MLCKNDDKSIKLWSLNEPDAVRVEINQLLTTVNKTWIQYPINVFSEYIKLGVKITDGFDILIWGNIPKNETISSQDALRVITAYTLDDQFCTNFIQEVLGDKILLENYEFSFFNCDVLKSHIASAYLQYDKFQLLLNSIEQDFLPLSMDSIRIVISNTHTPHNLDTAPYMQGKSDCKIITEKPNDTKIFKLKTILTEDNIDSLELSNVNLVQLKRFSHVLGEIQRLADGISALKEGDLRLFGRLMNDSHLSLRDNYNIVSSEVDIMVTEAWKIDGVVGSRMTGGGFGGCTLSLVKDDAIDELIKKNGYVYETQTGIKPCFFIAKIGDYACKLNL